MDTLLRGYDNLMGNRRVPTQMPVQSTGYDVSWIQQFNMGPWIVVFVFLGVLWWMVKHGHKWWKTRTVNKKPKKEQSKPLTCAVKKSVNRSQQRKTVQSSRLVIPRFARISRELTDTIWEQYRDAVVELFMVMDEPGFIFNKQGLYKGTAWFCTSDGYLATAGHNTIISYQDGGVVNGQLRKASKIMATVTNVNGEKDVNQAFECRIVNVAGAMDCALLHIKEITNQRYISWGNSLNTLIGSKCIVIGNPLGQNLQSVTRGTVRNNMYFEPEGQQIPESVFVDDLSYEGNSGSPMLNERGEAIGIYTFGDPETPGFGGGISQRMAQPVIEEMIAYDRQLQAERNGTLPSPLLGRKWKSSFPHIDPSNGAFIEGFCGIVFAGYSEAEMYELGNKNSTIGGAVVLAKIQNIWTDVQPMDIIMEIDGIKIGILPGQTAPSTATLMKRPEDQVQITLQRGKAGTKWQTLTLMQPIAAYPAQYDYPLSFVAKTKVHISIPSKEQRRIRLVGPKRVVETC